MAEEVKYVIVSDVNNKINYQEVYDKEIDRDVVAAQRQRLEEFKQEHDELELKKAEIERRMAEVEAEIAHAEKIIAIADEKKAQEQAELEAQNEVVGE